MFSQIQYANCLNSVPILQKKKLHISYKDQQVDGFREIFYCENGITYKYTVCVCVCVCVQTTEIFSECVTCI